MKILLTGANGYIGKRLLPVLLENGHEITCLVRDPRRFELEESLKEKVQIVKADLLDEASLQALPTNIDAAYYLVHSMGGSSDFYSAEARSATNFRTYLDRTSAKQVIYLSGLSYGNHLSQHMASRSNVAQIMRAGRVPVTVLRASIIIGSGSASFEIIRDLVEKLPVMVTPKWLNSRCQPIAIRDVLFYLSEVLTCEKCWDQTLDIGGPDILTYKQMLLKLAELRGLKRRIITLPILTPKLSSYWLYFLTSTSFSIARSLVASLKADTVVQNDQIKQLIPHECITYEEALKLAFSKIEQNSVISSWTDALVSGTIRQDYMDFVQIPQNGVLTDKQIIPLEGEHTHVLDNIWQIGGQRGWYKTDWLWNIRGFLDKLVGGVGLRRGRRHPFNLKAGDTLDFWRVLLADKQNKRLLLYAEMKLPGEAWLQFRIFEENGRNYLEQLAAFRPKGLWGRLYWYSLLPFHFIIFGGMARNLTKT
ncbi:SDR family oxidoreductase [Adhaeribacter sp. BT258]|uniref:SDR family oxidoreductase n=1 Tax=Adhaeribacter terrigena TaxID=2793070 RepID=A0ABS1C3B8_9BACT|nr:SDR family oxidoreductase [Adhaeribacter terrigena]MBK0403901.1 SDR family oxidoreductase [Adhaeribacter terrigena]